MNDEVHISSLVVHAKPDRLETIKAEMARMTGLELGPVDVSGKMVVTLESASEAGILDCLDRLTAFPGVLSANLVYHHCESATVLEEEINP